MAERRFSIGDVMGAVFVIGLGCAAVRGQNLLWSSTMLTLTLVGLGTATVLAVGRRDHPGALGAAVFGWSSLALTLATYPERVTRPRLLHTIAVVFVKDYLLEGSYQVGFTLLTRPDRAHYDWIVLSLETIGFAFFGGWLARRLAPPVRPPGPPPPRAAGGNGSRPV